MENNPVSELKEAGRALMEALEAPDTYAAPKASYEELEARVKRLEAEKAVLDQELQLYQRDGAVGMYYELNKMVNKTVELMRKKNNLAELTGSSDKGDKEFERMMKLVDNSVGWLEKLDLLKIRLGLSGSEETDQRRQVKAYQDRLAEDRQ